MGKYFGGFTDRDNVASQFDMGNRGEWNKETHEYPPYVVSDGFPSDSQILFASYADGGYDGDATVVFERDGKLFEVNGSHCSCYGLEDQWIPEETSWEAMALRPRDRYVLSQHDDEAKAAFWSLIDAHSNGVK